MKIIHPTAVIDDGALIGNGTKIWHFCHVSSGASIGLFCKLGQNVYVADKVAIGNGCKIQNNVSIYSGVILEDDVFVGPSVVFTNDMNPRAAHSKRGVYISTLIMSGASLGANSTIICGVSIGKCAFVGAGTVVRESVPDYAVVVGNPARQIGWMCECGERLLFNHDKCCECSCGLKYSNYYGNVVVRI